jgi:hypothetical protein
MPPAGFKRSRALWDEALRRPHPSTLEAARAWVAAISYELQPIRLSESNQRHFVQSLRSLLAATTESVRALPGICAAVARFLAARTRTQWMMAALTVGYYFLVRWIHEYVLFLLSLV